MFIPIDIGAAKKVNRMKLSLLYTLSLKRNAPWIRWLPLWPRVKVKCPQPGRIWSWEFEKCTTNSSIYTRHKKKRNFPGCVSFETECRGNFAPCFLQILIHSLHRAGHRIPNLLSSFFGLRGFAVFMFYKVWFFRCSIPNQNKLDNGFGIRCTAQCLWRSENNQGIKGCQSPNVIIHNVDPQ